MFESAAFESAAFEALYDVAGTSTFTWSGEATMDFVAVPRLVALIESGRGQMAFAAEIFLRSL
jgi:hypothetical protein